MQNNIF